MLRVKELARKEVNHDYHGDYHHARKYQLVNHRWVMDFSFYKAFMPKLSYEGCICN